MPLPEKLERVPPVTMTSLSVKLLDAEVRVKVIVAVWLIRRMVLFVEIEMFTGVAL